MAGVAAQGVTITFAGVTFTATSFSVNDSQDLIDGSHMGQAPNTRREYVGGFAGDREISVDFIGQTVQAVGTSGTITIAGPGSLSVTGTATMQSNSLTGSVGALITGSATWRVV